MVVTFSFECMLNFSESERVTTVGTAYSESSQLPPMHTLAVIP